IEAAGWLYPEAGIRKGMLAHHDIAYLPEQFLVPGTEGRRALAKLKGGPNLLFSAEGFAYLDADQTRTLANIVGAEQIQILLMLRDPLYLFYATWKERVKHGHLQSLPEFFMQHFSDPSASNILNPVLVLRKFAHLGERFSLVVQPYDHLKAEGTDIVSHLWHGMLGIEAPFEAKVKTPNTSLSIAHTEFLRLLLREYRAEHPAHPLNVARICFTRIVKGARPDKANMPKWLRGDTRDYGAEIDEAFAEISEMERLFTLDRGTSVHSYIRHEVFTEFGDRFAPQVTEEQVYATDPVRLRYYDSEDLLRSVKISRLIKHMIPEIAAMMKERIGPDAA
ncbi:MAG: hypothetical protein AAF908_09720, partial [Pseudomonadota bacterium]